MLVLHVIAAELRPDVDPETLEHATRTAAPLADAPGVLASFAGCSATQLVAAVWLDGPLALEPFAASPPHMNFVMKGLAPAIAGMWSVSISADQGPPRYAPAALWAFAVPEADGIFEWQVERQLDAIRDLPGRTWVGPTIEERERYRAGGIVLLAADELDSFEARSTEPGLQSPHLDIASVPSLAERASS